MPAKPVISATQWRERAAALKPRGQVFIDGRFVAAANGATFDNINPATGRSLGMISSGEQIDIERAVDSARADLPSSMNSPTVSKVTTSGSAILTFTIESGQRDETDLSWFVDNDVAKAMRAVKGVGAISRVGGVDREVHVDLDPTLMTGLGVTPSDVSSRLKAVQTESSGGEGQVGGRRQATRTIATVGTPAIEASRSTNGPAS